MDAYLKHFGVLGMKWGIRKDSLNIKMSYRDKQEKRYLERGYSKKDAESLAKRKAQLRTGFLIAGGITAAIGVAAVARYASVELRDVKLKGGAKAFHIARGEIKDLEEGRNLFVTIGQLDRFAYRARLGNPKNLPRIERTFETLRELKVPSPHKASKFYEEYARSHSDEITRAFRLSGIAKSISYKDFNTMAPYFSEGEGWHKMLSNNKAGADLWKDYQQFIISKGYQGLLDENDRNPMHGFNVERPTILFDAAKHLKEVNRRDVPIKMQLAAIPTIREASTKMVGIGALITGTIGLKGRDRIKSLEAYRKVYPNNKLEDDEILDLFNSGKVPMSVYYQMAEDG